VVAAWRNRAGGTQLGCVGSLVLLGLFIYAVAILGPPWLRYQQFRDEIHADAQFASSLTDSVIRNRIVLRADSLRLPNEAAQKLSIRRTANPRVIIIRTQYSERLHFFLLGDKLWTFKPRVEEPI
jgi:hypothetical protein